MNRIFLLLSFILGFLVSTNISTHALDPDVYNKLVYENNISVFQGVGDYEAKSYVAVYRISQQKIIGAGANTKTLLLGDIYFIRVNQEPAFENDKLLGYISSEELNQYILPNVAEYEYDSE